MTGLTRRGFVTRAGVLAGSAALYQVAGTAGAAHAAVADGAGLAFKSAGELCRLLRGKDVSSVELTGMFISRIEKYAAKLNAIVVRDFERALAAAKAADAALARGDILGPLHGLPMTIKESYDIAGLPTTWGYPDAADFIADDDALVVARYKQAGAHFMGKTNVPISLGDFQSYNEIYGTTSNPWDTGRTPGGSSGGSAVALATGMTGLDSGSDIGGSIRNPAHYCGVYGHKPTWGVVPMRGHTPPGVPRVPGDPDLAVVGPLARSAEDLRLAMGVIAGPDVLAAPAWKLQLPPPRMNSLKGLRIALWMDDAVAPVDRVVSDRLAELGEQLVRAGATVSNTARPEISSAQSHETYMTLLLAITGDPGAETNIKHQDWMRLNGLRNSYRVRWQAFFRDWDVVLAPISPTTAFAHDHSPAQQRTLKINGEPQPYFDQVFWAGIATVAYLPSTVFPTGVAADGLPIGLQAIGAEFDDATTIEFARLMAQEIGGFVAPPGDGA